MSRTFGALALASGALFAGDALAGTIDELRQTKTLRTPRPLLASLYQFAGLPD